jgi:DnaJ homolog subfamily C member 2
LDPVDGIKKCPPLGNNDTDVATVNKFYGFWTNFESWREFSKYDKNTHEQIK